MHQQPASIISSHLVQFQLAYYGDVELFGGCFLFFFLSLSLYFFSAFCLSRDKKSSRHFVFEGFIWNKFGTSAEAHLITLAAGMLVTVQLYHPAEKQLQQY